MQIALAGLRSLLGLVFVLAGAYQLVAREASVAQFAHWGLPAPRSFSLAIGATEVVCGFLLAIGALTRPVALLLATIMVGATFTAGRIDGGPYLIVPPILFALCVLYAWRMRRYGGHTPARRPGVQ